MRDFLHSVHDWPGQHIVAFTIILTVITYVLGMYTNEVKQFLSLPPQQLGIRWLKSRYLSATKRLTLLEYYHEHPHSLVIIGFAVTFTYLSLISVLSFATMVHILNPVMLHARLIGNVFLVALYSFFVILSRYYTRFIDSYNFEKSRLRIRAHIVQLRNKIEDMGFEVPTLK